MALANLSANQVARPEQPRRPNGVPEASLPCTSEEQAWWTELRTASEDVKYPRRPGEKQRKKFLTVLRNGAEKSLAPPIPDARSVILWKTEPQYTNAARDREINGTVTLQVELLANGGVGKIEVIQGLPEGLNDAAAEAARKTIFLPAVKNRQFVSSSVRLVMTFNIY
ncbi:MAG TPA: TonB family protein [Pyrinomonadaceae bacterium]|nr:TonB family protein [Pyrinomonadaceae bacterium]